MHLRRMSNLYNVTTTHRAIIQCSRAMRDVLGKSLLIGLLAVGGCDPFPGPRVRSDASATELQAEAKRTFRPGSTAANFEAWFIQRAGKQLILPPQRSPDHQDSGSCEIRVAALRQTSYCVSELFANYCVDRRGKLASLELTMGGYC